VTYQLKTLNEILFGVYFIEFINLYKMVCGSGLLSIEMFESVYVFMQLVKSLTRLNTSYLSISKSHLNIPPIRRQ